MGQPVEVRVFSTAPFSPYNQEEKANNSNDLLKLIKCVSPLSSILKHLLILLPNLKQAPHLVRLVEMAFFIKKHT